MMPLEDINMKPLMLLCAILLLPISLAAEQIDSQIQQILAGSMAPELVPAKDRDMVAEKLRLYADSQDVEVRRQATTALLNVNDTQTILRVVRDISSSSPPDRKVAVQALTHGCRNPEVINYLEDPLNISEDSGVELIQGEFLLPRQSVVASHAICRIIASSAAFPVATRDWAFNLNDVPPDELREIMRTWWEINAQYMKAKAYDQISTVSRSSEIK